jgi:hypothetical protein
MAIQKNSSQLDPTSLNKVEVSKIKNAKKGTPNGTFAEFNYLPPGMKIENQPFAVDVKRDAALEPKAPLLSSDEKYFE